MTCNGAADKCSPFTREAQRQEFHDCGSGGFLVQLRIRVDPGEEFGEHLVAGCSGTAFRDADGRLLLTIAEQRCLIDASPKPKQNVWAS